jgi:hypothetical protein
MTILKYTTSGAAGVEIHTSAERHMSAKGGTYADAVHMVPAADRQLAEAYAMPASRVTPKPLPPRPAALAPVQMEQGIPAGEIVHSRAQALIAQHPHLDYHEAMGAVLNQDPTLKARYAGGQR